MKRCNRRERLRSKIRVHVANARRSLVTAGPKVTRTAVARACGSCLLRAWYIKVLASAKGE